MAKPKGTCPHLREIRDVTPSTNGCADAWQVATSGSTCDSA
jgi:hypothetical protein